MSATIIDGKAFAARVRGKVAAEVARIKEAGGVTPGLAVVLVGEEPARSTSARRASRPSRWG
jgi:methylenetetrahydrofolate dehydrogenase (NADP+)/methenyltetrahydrofolate cyclohydrolase